MEPPVTSQNRAVSPGYGGLAAARRPHQGGEFSLWDGQVQMAKHLLALCPAIGKRYIPHLDAAAFQMDILLRLRQAGANSAVHGCPLLQTAYFSWS